jgi:hypothetical protein
VESVAILLAAIGALYLGLLGLATLWFGITADTASDFPFNQLPWVRPGTVIAILLVSPAWLFMLPGVGGILLSSGFALAAAVLFRRGRGET